MASCSVKTCRNNTRFSQGGLIFHTFPKEEVRQKEWLNILGISDLNWKWSKNRIVCSNHFKAEDYIGKRLKTDAVPSLNLNVPFKSSSCCSEPSTSRIDDSRLDTTIEDKFSIPSLEKRKIKIGRKPEKGEHDSTSSSSSGSKRRIAFLKTQQSQSSTEHNYSVSPRQLTERAMEMKKKLSIYKRRLFNANKTIRSLKKKVLELSTAMDFLKKDQQISESTAHHLEETDSVPHMLMKRYMKNIENCSITHENYPPVLKEFAATLQFYSREAYEEVRKHFAMALPHPATIRKKNSRPCSEVQTS